jgi:TolB protein
MKLAGKIAIAPLTALLLAGCGDSKKDTDSRGSPPAARRAPSARAAWSPTGADILFVSNRGGNPDIWLLAADATEPVDLTRHNASDNWPEWSPDGKRIAFQSLRNGKLDIFVMNADGSGLVQLTSDEEHDYLPGWSPDGQTIVFTSWRSEEGDTGRANHIYTMGGDGSNQRRVIAATPGVSSGATFAPNGRELVFSRGTGERSADIVVASMENGEERWVTADSSAFNGSPVFSPDGNWIAFYADRDSTSSLDVVRADGSERRSVVTEGQNWYPRWSPDGKWLIYVAVVRGNDENLDVRAASVETGEVVPLITGPGRDSEGRWRP